MTHARRSFHFASVLGFTCLLLAPSAPAAQDDLVALEDQAVKAAVAKIAPSALRIETVGGLERVERVLVGTGATTGLAVSPDGYIISSAFNFIQQPSSILVTLPSGKRAAAQIVGHLDAGTDVAVCSNAGYPGLSDPGYIAIALAVAAYLLWTAPTFQVVPAVPSPDFRC